MSRLKLKAGHRRILRDMEYEAMSLQYDIKRRFRNAVLSLALSEPRWMVWVENNMPGDLESCLELQNFTLLESYARAVVLKAYSFYHREKIGWMLFRGNQAFTDRGTLSPG